MTKKWMWLFGIAYVVTLALLSDGCASEPSNPDFGPVDGPYTVQLTQIHEVCYDLTQPEGSAPFEDKVFPDTEVQLDAFLKPDGRLDLKHSSGYLPGVLDGMIPGIERTGATVDQYLHVARPESETAIRSIGTITPTTLALDFTETYNDGSTACEFTVRADGTRRAIADTKSFDGYYLGTLTLTQFYCDDPGNSDVAVDGERVRIDVREKADGSLYAWIPSISYGATLTKPEADGSLDYDGDMNRTGFDWASHSYRPYEGSGKVHGVLTPMEARLYMTYADSEAGGVCATIELETERLVPSRRALQNDYRAQFDITSDCPSEPSGTKFGTITVEELGEGMFVTTDLGSRFDVAPGKDGTFIYHDGSLDADGYEMTVEGSITPPFLDYEVTQIAQISATETCTFSVGVHGETRYVF